MNNDRLKNEYIRILKEQIEQSGIQFKYFATITYKFKQTSLSKVSSDNAELRRTIRSFYDEPIRVWSFIEEHLDPSRPHFGGYHRHLLIEEASPARWRKPSRRMETFLLEHDPEALFAIRMGGAVNDRSKWELMKRVLRLDASVPNGHLGLDLQCIYDQEGALGYCCKHGVGSFDPANSDIDFGALKNHGTQARSKTVFV